MSIPKRRVWSPRRLGVRLGYMVVLAAMALFAWKFIHKVQEVRSLSRQESALRAQNAQIRSQNDGIRRSIAYYHSPEYIESQARWLLGFVRPGEVSVQVKLHYAGPAVRAAPPVPVATVSPVWHQWWTSFFHH